MRLPRQLPLLLVLAAFPAAFPSAASAAWGSPDELPKYGVSPLLPPEHWAVRAAARLDGMGLVTGWLPANQAAPMYMVWAALDEGARRAEKERPAMAAVARGWKEKFQQEWRGIDEKGLLRFIGGQASIGYQYDTVSPEPAGAPRTGPPARGARRRGTPVSCLLRGPREHDRCRRQREEEDGGEG